MVETAHLGSGAYTVDGRQTRRVSRPGPGRVAFLSCIGLHQRRFGHQANSTMENHSDCICSHFSQPTDNPHIWCCSQCLLSSVLSGMPMHPRNTAENAKKTFQLQSDSGISNSRCAVVVHSPTYHPSASPVAGCPVKPAHSAATYSASTHSPAHQENLHTRGAFVAVVRNVVPAVERSRSKRSSAGRPMKTALGRYSRPVTSAA